MVGRLLSVRAGEFQRANSRDSSFGNGRLAASRVMVTPASRQPRNDSPCHLERPFFGREGSGAISRITSPVAITKQFRTVITRGRFGRGICFCFSVGALLLFGGAPAFQAGE